MPPQNQLNLENINWLVENMPIEITGHQISVDKLNYCFQQHLQKKFCIEYFD